MRIYRPLCACFAVLACASVALAANDVWDANGVFPPIPPSGFWGTNVNWADNTTPGNSDTATFNLPAAYTVTFNANPLAIQALTLTGTIPIFTSSGGTRTLSVTSASGGQDVTIHSGSLLTLGTSANPLHLTVGDDLIVNGGSLLNVNFGSQVNTLDLRLATDIGGGNGAVVVDGSTSELNAGNISAGLNGNTATLTYRSGAQGTVSGSVTLAQSGNAASTATLNVESSSDLVTGDLNVGTGSAASTGTVNISGSGSSLIIQSGVRPTLTVGTSAAGIGNINIGTSASGATLTTGVGAMTINATGTVTIGSASTFGTLNVNGGLLIDGGTLERVSGFIEIASGEAVLIQNGGAMNLTGGESTDANVTYIVAGVGSQMTTDNILTLRNGATIQVVSGATVSALARLDISDIGSGGGTLIVDGAGSSVSATGSTSLWGHAFGTASVTFSNGATGNFSGLDLAGASGVGGDITVTVNVLSGADLNTGFRDLLLATAGGVTTSATLNVQGVGSTVTQTANVPTTDLIVGHASSGNATINIGTTASGGILSTGIGTLTINATGTVNIGSGATNTGSLNANGNVTIDGGTLTRDSGSTFALADGKTMTIENGGSASFTNSYTTATNAIYNVSGPGSTLESVTGSVSISNAAQMNISFGGLVSSAGILTVGSGGNGTLSVDGSGSSLVSTGPTNAWGRVGNTATVTFSNNATGTLSGHLNLAQTATANTTTVVDVLSGADLTVGGNLALTFDGGASTSATLNVQGSGSTFTQSGANTLTIGHASTGVAALNIGTTTSGGTFTTGTELTAINKTGAVTIGSGANRGTLNANGDVTIDGGTLTRGFGSVFNLAAGKTVTIENGGSASFTGAYTTATNAIYNVIGGGSMLETTDALAVGGGAQLNVGTTISGGTVTSASMQILSTGFVTVGTATTTGRLNVDSDVSINGGTAHLVNGVMAAGSITLAGGGTFDFDGGTLHVGQFTGDLVNQGGTLAPGQSPGITNITGDYTQLSAATLQIEIGGTTPGTQFDRLTIADSASLDGTLDVSLINGFTPTGGQQFMILTAGSIFNNGFMLTGSAASSFSLLVSSTSVILQAIGLAGDYNNNGNVDAADYVLWRKNNNTATTLPNDATPGTTSTDYDVWRAHFGQPPGSGTGATANATVPEPSTLVLLMFAATGWCLRRRRAA